MTLPGGRPSDGINSLSGFPSTYSITMKLTACPEPVEGAAAPTSWMVQMCGWFSADAARASARMRPAASSVSCRILIATVRWSFAS